MEAGRFITDIKEKFRRGDIVTQLIYINAAVFLIISLGTVLMRLFNQAAFPWMNWLGLPAWALNFISQPWSLLTYMFIHADILHILFNMLWLYWFGRLFLSFFSAKHLRGLYILGGICGGLLYLFFYNIFPYFSPFLLGSKLIGASASVLAIVVATAVREPNYPVQFMFVGTVRLKYIALFTVILDLLFITSDNAGGHIAHLGGALAGWWFAAGLSGGHDVTKWINNILDFGIRQPKVRKPKMKVHYGDKQKDYNFNARKKEREEEIDRILEKVRKSGYKNLTEEEKKRLFDASKR